MARPSMPGSALLLWGLSLLLFAVAAVALLLDQLLAVVMLTIGIGVADVLMLGELRKVHGT